MRKAKKHGARRKAQSAKRRGALTAYLTDPRDLSRPTIKATLRRPISVTESASAGGHEADEFRDPEVGDEFVARSDVG